MLFRSIVIAVTASFAALNLAFHLRGNAFGVAILSKIGSAVLMGIAITGMHYTGMAAAQFAPGSFCLAATSAGISTEALPVTVGVVTFFILRIALGVSALDAPFAAKLTYVLCPTTVHDREEVAEGKRECS